MKALNEAVLRYGYPLPEHLTQIDSFAKLKELAQFWFLPKSPALNVEISADKWIEKIEYIPDNFSKLPFNKDTFAKEHIIEDINALLELENINPLLAYYLLSTYECLCKLELSIKNGDGIKIIGPWNSLFVLGHFKNLDIVRMLYISSPDIKNEIEQYSNKISCGDDLLYFGANVALLLCERLIEKNQFNTFVATLFPPNICYDELIELDRRFSPILLHPVIWNNHPEAVTYVTTYMTELLAMKHPDIVENIVKEISEFQELVKTMQQYGPFIRVQICRHSIPQTFMADEDQFGSVLTLLQVPKPLLMHFRSSLSEILTTLDQSIRQSQFFCNAYRYSNNQLLFAGLYANHEPNTKTGQIDYLICLYWRITLGLVKNIVEAVDLLRKLFIAHKSQTINIDPELLQTLEASILNYLHAELDKSDFKTPPICLFNLEKIMQFPQHTELYAKLTVRLNANQSLKQRCLQVLCYQDNANTFFSKATDTNMPEKLLLEGRDILNDRQISSILEITHASKDCF